MSDKKLQLSRRAAIALLIVVLALGGALATLIGEWIGHPVLAASSTVPVYLASPVAASSAAMAAAPSSIGFAAVVKPALPAVVNISSSRVVRTGNSPMAPFLNDPFFRQFFGNQSNIPRERREQSLGSGVIVSPDGYVLTNNHVVDGATDIKVALSDKRELKGRVIGRDPKTDLAIVKIDATHLPTLALGDSAKLQVGDYVLAIGDPFGVGETVTQGIVSATGRAGLNIEGYEDFIQTDAAINPGNSGGALIDAHGDLVGINTAILSSAGGSQGVGFAIPINLARNVMDQIIRNGKVVRGWLGISIQDVTPAIAKAFNVSETHGALVSDVDPKGPSAHSGLKQGDVITRLNGKPISGPNDLRLQIAEMEPGSVAHLQVDRTGQSQEIGVKLGELPEQHAQVAANQGRATGPLAGVQVEALTRDTARQLNLPADTRGVVVESVSPDSAAASAGLQRGDVIQEINRKPVNSVGDYEQALKLAGSNQPLVLLDDRGGTRSFVVVHPNS
jgi:serine protease Do